MPYGVIHFFSVIINENGTYEIAQIVQDKLLFPIDLGQVPS